MVIVGYKGCSHQLMAPGGRHGTVDDHVAGALRIDVAPTLPTYRLKQFGSVRLFEA
jgi:hypothetical protein